MSVLFDERERGDAFADEHSGEHRSADSEIELEFDNNTPATRPNVVPDEAAPAQDGQMSIDKLLKRFGIR